MGTEGLLTGPRGDSRASGVWSAPIPCNTGARRSARRRKALGPVRLEAFWAFRRAAPNPGSAGEALAGRVNQRELAAVGRFQPPRRCPSGDRERQRLGDAGKALPAQWRGGSAVTLATVRERCHPMVAEWPLVVAPHRNWRESTAPPPAAGPAARTARPPVGSHVGDGDTAVVVAPMIAESVNTHTSVGRAAPTTDR
jgi:hypothetical protein